MTQPPTTPKDRTALPLVLSLTLHTLVGVGLFFWRPSVPEPAPVGIETTFISAGEFAQIEAMVKENAAATAKGQQGTDTISTSTIKEPSAKMQAYNEEMARREAQFNAEIQALAQELDEQILGDMQAIEEQVLTQQQQEAQKLAEVAQAYESSDEEVAQNRVALMAATKARDERLALAEQEKKAAGGVSASLQTSPTSSAQISSGTQSVKTTATGGGDTNALISALIRLIEPKWHVPANAKGERLTAVITTDQNGNVLSVQVKGGSQTLKASLESAIFNASPLTPLKGTDHQSLTIHFVAEPPAR